MNNEPVAFMCPTGLEYKQPERDFMYNDSLYPKDKNWIPLYTHPAKTLTDEEIIEVWCVLKDTNSAEHDAKVFARAILRKANEK